MRNLKKPAAQAIQHLNEEDEMDDMPFIMAKGGGASRKPQRKQAPNIQLHPKQQERQYLEPQPFGADPLSEGRKPISGASKISDSGLGIMHGTQDS